MKFVFIINHYCPVKRKRVRRFLRYARNDVHIQIIISGGGVGWRRSRQPTPPPERISQIPVIAIRQLAEKQSVVLTGQ